VLPLFGWRPASCRNSPAIFEGKTVINYFSPRGAMRGIVLAAATALLWACWAIGYVQGFSGVSAPEVIWILN
jgi:hypothetical protein